MVMFKGPGWCARCVAVSGWLWEWWGAREPGAGRRHGQVTQCSLDIYSQYCPHHHPPSLGHKLIINTLWDMVWMVRVLMRCGLQVAESPADIRPSRGERESWRGGGEWNSGTSLICGLTLQGCVAGTRCDVHCPLSIPTPTNKLHIYRAPLLLCLVTNVFCIVITRVIK